MAQQGNWSQELEAEERGGGCRPGRDHVGRGHWSSESRYRISRVDLDLSMSSGYTSLCEQSHLCKATDASHGLLKIPWHRSSSSGFVQREGAVSTRKVPYKGRPEKRGRPGSRAWEGAAQRAGGSGRRAGGAVGGGHHRDADCAGRASIFLCAFNTRVMVWGTLIRSLGLSPRQPPPAGGVGRAEGPLGSASAAQKELVVRSELFAGTELAVML